MADETKNTEIENTETPAPEAEAVEAAPEPETPVAEPPEAETPEAPAEKPAPKARATKAKAAPAKAKPKATAKPARARVAKKPEPKERGTYRREPKPERFEGRRKERRGVVVSNGADKTITVRIDTSRPHPRYHKIVRMSLKLHAHDERNEAKVGDVVRVVETRPLSKMKRWRLVEVLEAAK
jgi:small subunit ribosomal protein S17